MTVTEVLTDAKWLIQEPTAWTRKAMARDRQGEGVVSTSVRATSWCALGAVECALARRDGLTKQQTDKLAGASYQLLNQASKQLTNVERIEDLNDFDKNGHAEVLKAYEYAIALAQKRARRWL